METPAQDGPVQPVLVYDPAGRLVATVLQNRKASAKSLEQKQLWTVDGQTGRVLPWPGGGSLVEIGTDGPWLRAVVKDHLPAAEGTARPGAEAAPTGAAGSGSGNSDGAGSSASGSGDGAGFLASLEALVLDRQASLPEGSYTTHLFKGGLGKIRKKTGEEAVELILADSPETIRSEAADLLYHMTVLFAASGVSWQSVIDQLRQR